MRCLKLVGFPEYTEEWRWLADVKGLEEIEVSLGNEHIHVHGEEATVNTMSATGTLNIWLNLPEHMRARVMKITILYLNTSSIILLYRIVD